MDSNKKKKKKGESKGKHEIQRTAVTNQGKTQDRWEGYLGLTLNQLVQTAAAKAEGPVWERWRDHKAM